MESLPDDALYYLLMKVPLSYTVQLEMVLSKSRQGAFKTARDDTSKQYDLPKGLTFAQIYKITSSSDRETELINIGDYPDFIEDIKLVEFAIEMKREDTAIKLLKKDPYNNDYILPLAVRYRCAKVVSYLLTTTHPHYLLDKSIGVDLVSLVWFLRKYDVSLDSGFITDYLQSYSVEEESLRIILSKTPKDEIRKAYEEFRIQYEYDDYYGLNFEIDVEEVKKIILEFLK